jgi:adenylate cyclase
MIRGDILAREVDLIRVVGKSKPERIYQPIGEKNEVTPDGVERITVFHQALQLYRKKQWDEALPLFESFEKDRVAQIYVDRTLQLRKSPPPEDWSGVHELKEK